MPRDVLVLFVIFAIILLVVRFGVPGLSALLGSKYRAYRQLAHRFRGRYESRGLSEPPTVSFSHRGANVRVGLAPTIPGQPSPPRTRVVARFSKGLPFRLELYPYGRSAPPQPAKGTRPTRIGQVEFDRAYHVQSNDPEIAAEFLQSAGAQIAIERLRRLCPPSGMLVSINPERLLVQVDRNLGSQSTALEAAVHDALVLHDLLVGSVGARLSEGIAIVGNTANPGTPENLGPPVCKVCGERIVEMFVICVQCQTPHHGDCWTFVGGCSIFGCQGKQFLPGPPKSQRA